VLLDLDHGTLSFIKDGDDFNQVYYIAASYTK
jgi:hypothetical protein